MSRMKHGANDSVKEGLSAVNRNSESVSLKFLSDFLLTTRKEEKGNRKKETGKRKRGKGNGEKETELKALKFLSKVKISYGRGSIAPDAKGAGNGERGAG